MSEIELPVKRDDASTIEERMTENAYYNIFPSRYLLKDEDGNVIETVEEAVERVAKNVAVDEAVQADEEIWLTPGDVKPDHSSRDELIDEIEWEDEDPKQVRLNEKNAPYFTWDTVYPKAMPKTQEKMDEWSQKYEDLMSHLKFIPNSPTWMNAGDELQQLSACFVDSPGDDIDDIHQTAKEAAQVFQSGGGMGYGFWNLRPYGDAVGSTGGIASGPITFMRTYDQMCETIAQGGARRGAQMGVMRVSHPDIIQFIHAKNKDVSLAETLRLNDPDDPEHNSFAEALEEARELIDDDGKVPKFLRNAVEGHLSNFNISVGITDEFMRCVKEDEEYTFTNPRTGEDHLATPETKELYEMFGLGEFVEVGDKLSIPAREIWSDIVEGAHENGEPGIIFLERINKRHSFDVEEHPEHRIQATNPCGEQPLEEYEACNLGHINLSTIVDENAEFQDWRKFYSSTQGKVIDGKWDEERQLEEFINQAIDWDEFDQRIEVGTRFLDSVATMSLFPVDKIEEKVREMRKIGLGVMGLGQLLIQLGIRYGSDVGNEVTRQLMVHINHKSKSVSHQLAEERGEFAEWSKSKYADPTEYREWFEHHTGEDADDWEDGYKLRNHNTTTVAPTGTTSMVGNTTGGIEPIYNVVYYKNVSEDIQGDEMLVEFDDYFVRVLEEMGIDSGAVVEEAKELMAENEFTGLKDLDNVPEELAELFVSAEDLTAEEHAAVQCAAQEGVDSAISKTCNMREDASPEEMAEVYEYAYDHGAKGVTVYRDGSRSKQVLTVRSDNAEFADGDELVDVVEERLDDEDFGAEIVDLVLEHFDNIKEVEDKDLPWYENGHYAKKRDRPKVLHGRTERIKTGYGKMYVNVNFDDEGRPFELFVNIDDSGSYTNGFAEALGKSISTALRSGVDPKEIWDKLIGINAPKIAWEEGQKIHSIPDGVGRGLKRAYITENGLEDEYPEMSGELTSPVSDGGDAAVIEPTQTQVQPEPDIEPGKSCADCGQSEYLVPQGGCLHCEACGWEECG